MPEPPVDPRQFGTGFGQGLRPPKGFEAEKYPLRHKMYYAGGLSRITATMNSAMFTLIRNYKSANDASLVVVNPHNEDFVKETGSVCAKMSIIDKLQMDLKFSLQKTAQNDQVPIHAMWMPIFFSFPEKLDAADDKTGTTVSSILNLLKDATEEDITPLFNNTKLDVTGTSDRSQPLSNINLTETVAIMNMDTNATMEAISWDEEVFYNALSYYTNKGALKACIGKIRHFTLDRNRPSKRYRLDKFVPRSVRRIMPYSFMAILIHCPVTADDDQYYLGIAGTGSIADIGVTCMVKYHEWNFDHIQDSN